MQVGKDKVTDKDGNELNVLSFGPTTNVADTPIDSRVIRCECSGHPNECHELISLNGWQYNRLEKGSLLQVNRYSSGHTLQQLQAIKSFLLLSKDCKNLDHERNQEGVTFVSCTHVTGAVIIGLSHAVANGRVLVVK
jgi:hypothetical protein